MKKQLFILIVLGLALMSCNNDVQTVITVKLNPSFITLSEGSNEPMKMKTVVSATDSVVYAIQVYENDAPYYFGLFNDVSKMQLALTTSKTYKFKVSAYKAGTGKGLKAVVDTAGTNYFLPTKTPLKNKFIKGDILKDIDLAGSTVLNSQAKSYPEVDAFYATKSLTLDKGITSIDFTLLRMCFGINFTVDALTSGNMEIYVGNDTLKLNNTSTSAYTVRQFSTSTNTFANIYSNASTFGDSIAVSAKWISGSGTTVTATGKYKFTRNYQKTINIQLNSTTNTFNFEGWAPQTVTDIDANVYKTVTIGTQTWMAENLKVTHFRDGTAIPNVTSNTTWTSTYSAGWCDYNNSTTNGNIYGHLYNIYVIRDSKNICPIGWHLPTVAEFQTLINYLGGDSLVAGKKIIESGTIHWATETGATNLSGFTALPAGARNHLGVFGGESSIGNGDYLTISNNELWWSSTIDNPNGNKGVKCRKGRILNNVYIDQRFGVSIRCIKD